MTQWTYFFSLVKYFVIENNPFIIDFSQASDPRLLRTYKRVVNRPNGQALGEFMFITGIIPSDTDFRIWRDFGDIHGKTEHLVTISHKEQRSGPNLDIYKCWTVDKGLGNLGVVSNCSIYH